MEIELNYYEDFFHVAVDTYKEIEKLEKELLTVSRMWWKKESAYPTL